MRVKLARTGAAILLLILCPGLGLAAEAAAVPAASPDTLALVNGEPLTTADLDAAVMATHATMDMRRLAGEGARRLLEKAINDLLILQEAEAIGLDEEPQVTLRLEKSLAEHATRAYVNEAFALPDSVPPDRVQAHFDRFYGKVKLRQVSLPTAAEARAALAAVAAGADMDSLARAASVDSRRIDGGLHNLKPWADVEEVLRAAVRGLPAGALSDVFPFREAHAFLRVEQVLPPDPADLPAVEATIRARELALLREAAWYRFLDGLEVRTPLVRIEPTLADVAADSARAVHPGFQDGSGRPALLLVAGADSLVVDERELRALIFRIAMTGGVPSFAAQMEKGIAQARQELLLAAAAAAAGWYDRPEIRERFERDRRRLLLESYLEQTIVPRIVFNRDEFRAYWEAHEDEFREPAEIKLATALIEDPEKGKAAAAQLADGADFEHVRRRHGLTGETPESKWVSTQGFTDEIRQVVEKLEPGRAAGVETGSGWLLVKVDGRRPGRVRSLEDSEMQIREALFQERFKAEMDRHLGLLKERSEIVRHEERIARYFGDQG